MAGEESSKQEARASTVAQERSSTLPSGDSDAVVAMSMKYQTTEDKRTLTEVPVDGQWHRVLKPDLSLSKECWDSAHADQRLAYGACLNPSWILALADVASSTKWRK